MNKQITPADKRVSQFYLRLHVKDEVRCICFNISNLFNQLGISFERILQTPGKKKDLQILLLLHIKHPYKTSEMH